MNIARRLLALALGKRLPVTHGTRKHRGVVATVSIRRDSYGVPYIRADHEADLWFALGFCHAQDRGGQLELLVRAVRGTLAEIVGIDALPIDELSRRVGFLQAGRQQLEVADDDIQEQLDAYARGINAGFEVGLDKPPHEHALLGCAPSVWRAEDVQGYCALLCFALASNWDVELMRLFVAGHDGVEAVAALDAPYPAALPVCMPPGTAAGEGLAAAERLAEDIASFQAIFGSTRGSNAWAISGVRTRSGKPLLSCDPHLPSGAPPLVYLAQARCPQLEAAGATFVGVPGFVPGHNGFAAWGVTAAHADNTDLFIEELGEDRSSVRHGEGLVVCPVREERILVKGDLPRHVRVLETPRGPIISPALDDMPASLRRYALSLSGSWLARRPYRGFLSAHRARSPHAFRELFRQGSTSTVSAVYADMAGDIGWHLAAEVPLRRGHHGLMPVAGWDEARGWDGLVPFDALPRAVNPEAGFVSCANNQPVAHTDETPYLGSDWLDGYRQQALTKQLSQRDDWDVPSCSALQLDTRSLAWQQLRDSILAVAAGADAAAGKGLQLLSSWDGRVSSDSPSASVYVLMVASLCRRLVRAKAPRSAAYALGRGATSMLPFNTMATRRTSHLVKLLCEQPSGYFEDWPAEIRGAIAEAVGELSARHGDDVAQWQWGVVRPLTLVHAFAEQAPFDRIFNVGPLAGEGDCTTISQGGVDLLDPTSNQQWLPMLRVTIDLANVENSRYSLSGGQSGNPLSPHYEDQLAAWRSGRGIAIAWSEARIAAATRATLTLSPR